MAASIDYEPDNNIYVMRISGTLKKSEFDAAQRATAAEIDSGAKPRCLALLEDFAGWEHGSDWSVDFLLSKGNEIEKIAIVGEPRWEAEALVFVGAGFRRAPVQFFATGQESEARKWLAS